MNLDLKQFNELIREVLDYLKVKKVEQLLRINDSPKQLKRLYEQFVLKQKGIERCLNAQQQLKAKETELILEENNLNDKLKLIVKKTKELQKQV